MFSSLAKNTLCKVRHPNTFILAMLVLAVPVCVWAQAPGSSRGLSSGDGTHTIQGRVFFPSGQALTGISMKVNLESTNGEGGSTTTDQDGSFRFNGVRAGTYSVVIDGGKEFENARESISIDPGGTSGPMTSVTIHLRPKVSASNPAFAGVPQNALDFYQKGAAAAQKGNAKSAAEFLSKAVEAYPSFSVALSELGIQYMKLGQMDKASQTFEALLKLKPNDAAAHLDFGIALYNQSAALLTDKKTEESIQRVGQAETQLRAAISLNSPGPTAHYYLGLSLIKLKRYDEAQAELETAIKNGGANIALAHKFLGGLYMNARRNKEAADELEKYLQLDPKATNADQIRGTIKDLRSKP
jgi:Flp pilus assembly protein TadD